MNKAIKHRKRDRPQTTRFKAVSIKSTGISAEQSKQVAAQIANSLRAEFNSYKLMK